MSDVLLRTELYCVVPAELADEVVESLRAHLAAEQVRVITERRDQRGEVPYEFRRQRALHLPRALPPLPEPLQQYAGRLRLVQRMPSPGIAYADDSVIAVVRAAQDGDGIAASELVWRVHARVASRLSRHLGEVVALTQVDAALGRTLDRLKEFEGRDEHEFMHWLDSVVDATER